MLPFADKTITLFNSIERRNEFNKTERHWFRKVLHGCTWARSANSVLVGDVQIKSDEIQVQVPESADFVPSWEWDNLPLEEVGDKWTGKAETVLVLGEVDDEIPTNGTDSSILSKYEGHVFRASSFVNHTGDGFPLGHYVFRG